jgi:uncharacterized membrane protein
MESRAKFLGHPVHPFLVVYPVGLLSAAVIFDLLYWAIGNEQLATFSFWAILVGVIGGLAAALFGLMDWLSIRRGTRAKRIGMFHGLGNLVVVGLFVLSFLARMSDPTYLPDTTPLLLGVLGLALALVTAWLGGELVYRLRVGVDDGANLDASSSLGEDSAGAAHEA